MKKQIVIVAGLLVLVGSVGVAYSFTRDSRRALDRHREMNKEDRMRRQELDNIRRQALIDQGLLEEAAEKQIVGQYQCAAVWVGKMNCFTIIIDTRSGEIVKTQLVPMTK